MASLINYVDETLLESNDCPDEEYIPMIPPRAIMIYEQNKTIDSTIEGIDEEHSIHE